MKELILFYMHGCGFCRAARQYMKELQAENPAYRAIPIRLVDENLHRKLANSYNYFYVPTFYLGDEKLSEGAVDKAGVRAVFDEALRAHQS